MTTFKVRTTLLVAAAVLVAGSAAAQVEVGIKGGVTFADVPKYATLIEEDEGNAEMRIGAAVGGHVAISLGGVVSLQTEVLYTQKGLEAEAPFGADETLQLRLDYIDVPVLLRLGPTGGNGLQFLAGPSFNFNTSARAVLEGVFDADEDIKDEIESFEIGLVLGVGYYGSLFTIEGRYQEGLTDIAKFADFFDDETYKNRTFLVMLGVRLGG
jgi:Outer membrane protein beta-barrel domain